MRKKKTHGSYCISCNMMLRPWLGVKKYGYPEEYPISPLPLVQQESASILDEIEERYPEWIATHGKRTEPYEFNTIKWKDEE